MVRILLVTALICFACAPSFAQTWSGYLVDAKCFDNEEQNVNPTDTMTAVDRDNDLEVRLCAPNAKTKSFVIMDHNGENFLLNEVGNAKAAEAIAKAGKRSKFWVDVNGEKAEHTLRVDSIIIAK